MKKIVILNLILILTLNLKSQTLNEKIVYKACECLDSLKTIAAIEDSLQSCINNSMAYIMLDGTDEEKKILGSAEGIINTVSECKDLIILKCAHIKDIFVQEQLEQYYCESENKTANLHYEKGTKLMYDEDYNKAIKELKKAIKIDDKFVFAYDHLAVSYRQKEKYKKAIEYYKKSLEICPVGDMALMNIAVVYSILEDYDNSLSYYNLLKFYHSTNPEGYFGAGKILFLQSDYENALANVFTAHIMYNNSGSDYIKDSEKLIKIIYADMKENDRLDLFWEVAKRYKININD